MILGRTMVLARLAAPLSLLMATACTSTQVVTANSTPAIQALDSETVMLLDIGVTPLDPGIPASEVEIEENFIVPDVRRAEAGYMAYHLKDTLELTGNWGAVRVTPNPTVSVDVHVSGYILQSDGELVKVRMQAVDSTGRVWLDRNFEDTASKYSYETLREDPFQDLYNEVANELLLVRDSLSDSDLRNIRRVSELKFARSLSPDAFSSYLRDSDGRTSVSQLPSESDVMLKRVDQIKEREYLFVDTMDDYYGRFYKDMRASYDEWRLATYEEAILLRELKSQANKRFWGGLGMAAAGVYAGSQSTTYAESAAASGVVLGGIGMVRSGLERKKDAEIHASSLRELGQSLGGEITPYILDVEGKTIELSGTADSQFNQWRDLLKQIYVEETGLTVQ